MWVTVEDCHQWRGPLGGKELVEDRIIAISQSAPRLQCSKHQISRRQTDRVYGTTGQRELVASREHLGDDSTDTDEGNRRSLLSLP
jgi:hypothetical protein